jgi:hypothetical protein
MNKPKVKLTGKNGNAMVIIVNVTRALKGAGWKDEEVKKVTQDMMSGDYDHLIQVAMEHCEVE